MSGAITGGGDHVRPEVLAAFLDGNLRDAERNRVTAHLAACEDCYEVFSDSAHILEEEEEEEMTSEPAADVQPGIVRPPRSRWRRVVVWAPLAAAAVLALVLLLPWHGPQPLPVAELAADLGGPAGRQALAATYPHHWSPFRSPDVVLSDQEQVAFRLGVRAVGLEIALASGDRELATPLAAEIESLLENVPLSEPVLAIYTDTGELRSRLEQGDPPAALLPLHHQGDRLLGPDPDSGEDGFTDPFWYRLGKWTAAAEIAAVSGNRAWFDASGSRRLLREARRRELPPAVEDPLVRLMQEVGAPSGERDLERIATAAHQVIRSAAES